MIKNKYFVILTENLQLYKKYIVEGQYRYNKAKNKMIIKLPNYTEIPEIMSDEVCLDHDEIRAILRTEDWLNDGV